jgi:hypothetical protein
LPPSLAAASSAEAELRYYDAVSLLPEEYERRLKNDPKDVNLWLEYAKQVRSIL